MKIFDYSQSESLISRIFNAPAMVWMVAGYGASQVIRFGGNIILASILAPESFGVMALVNSVISGMTMLSDVGIGKKLVSHPSAYDSRYRNTAWTIQVCKSLALFILLFLLSKPLQNFFQIDGLANILSVSGVILLLHGLRSTEWFFLEREGNFRLQVGLQLISQITGILIMISLAYYFKSVWALVVGGIVGALIILLSSHTLLSGRNNSFDWELSAVKDIFHFGKWVVISTAVAFLIGQGDRLLIGKLVTLRELGIYSIASSLVMLVNTLSGRLSNSVLYSTCCSCVRGTESDFKPFFKLRKMLILFVVLLVLFLSLCGEGLVELIYDERYSGAGWMLQLLALAAGFFVHEESNKQVLLSMDNAKSVFYLQLIKGMLFVFLVFSLGVKAGVVGCLVGMVVAQIISSLLVQLYLNFYMKFKGGVDWILLVLFVLLILSIWRFLDFPVFSKILQVT